MKLVTLNIWAGALFQPLIHFFHERHKEIDIFCLQEVWDQQNASDTAIKNAPKGTRIDIYSEIQNALPEFQGYFAPAQENAEGLAIFVRKNIPIEGEGDVFIYRSRDSMVGNDGRTLGRNLQYIQFTRDNKKFTICHFHGLWTGGGKTDTLYRIEQSKKVKAFLDHVQGAKVLCGDFNLLPNTESIKILEEGMRNLIKEYKINSTRSSLYTKPERFADYIFVSPDVQVKDLTVLQDTVSDHLPLQLEFS
jgi:endonuclease/exonuclease/phosphatase family metal-dependent hydrolase